MTKGRLILVAALIAVTLSPAFILHGQIGADGEIEIKITEGTMFAAVASPDRRSIAIDLLGALWILPIDGGDARKITPDTIEARRPSWSPDSQVARVPGIRRGWHIYTIKTERHRAESADDRARSTIASRTGRATAGASRSRPTDSAASPRSGKSTSTAAPCASCPGTSATIRAGRPPIGTCSSGVARFAGVSQPVGLWLAEPGRTRAMAGVSRPSGSRPDWRRSSAASDAGTDARSGHGGDRRVVHGSARRDGEDAFPFPPQWLRSDRAALHGGRTHQTVDRPGRTPRPSFRSPRR